MAEPLLTFQTPDGRELAYALWGDPDGFPILVLHGTPGCRLERWPDEDVYRRLGVCLVTHDRAGYGQSTRRPGGAWSTRSTTWSRSPTSSASSASA